MSWRALKLDADAVVSDGKECGVLVVGVLISASQNA